MLHGASRRTKQGMGLVVALLVGAGIVALLWSPQGGERLIAGEPLIEEHVSTAEGVVMEMTVYKSPQCGCCGLWVDHVREHDFEVTIVEDDTPDVTKSALGVPRALRSCHTAVVDGYVIEGHVPADVIRRFVAAGTDLAGIAVPGMPLGSPGMEVADASRHESYEVIAFDGEGNTRVYARR